MTQSTGQPEKSAFANALHLFHEAAERVIAYKDFLTKAGIKHQDIRNESDFLSVPLTDKVNYFSQYDLKELSWDGTLTRATYVSKSSGSTGVPFFWPRGEAQDLIIGEITQPIYEKIFGAHEGTTLFVNSFSLGTWIAGMEFFNSVRFAAEHGTAITVVTPSIDKVETINMVKKLAPLYSRVVLAGYPPFIKDILDHGSENGINWKDMDVRLFFAGEAVSEAWRDSVFALAGIHSDPLSRSVNIYGMAESGIVAHETPASILLRRHLKACAGDAPYFSDLTRATGLYQYNPMARYFEVVSGDSIVLTANAGLPLIRYNTRDNGGILPAEILGNTSLISLAKDKSVALDEWQLPFIYLFGRKDLAISFYALIIYNENLKYALEHSKYATRLSGLFTMSVSYTGKMDQQFDVTIELAKSKKPSEALVDELSREIAENIAHVNSEYAKLHSVLGDRALPRISLVVHGLIDTVPGRKHRWVKRS